MLHPYLSSAVARERQADRLREAEQFRLARLARAAHREASRTEPRATHPPWPKRVGGWLRVLWPVRPPLSAPAASPALASGASLSAVNPVLTNGRPTLTDRFPATFNRRAGASADGAGACVIACVEVDHPTASGSVAAPWAWEDLAVWRLGQCVRANDRVSPLGDKRFAVQFEDCAGGVAPIVLGQRLLKEMGERLTIGDRTLNLDVAVGMGTGTAGTTEADLMRETMVSLSRLKSLRTLDDWKDRPSLALVHMAAGIVRSSF